MNIVSFYGIVALMSSSCFLSWFHQRFFCGGRLIFGPDVASIFLSMLLIAAPAIGFCIKVYNKILDKGTKNPARWYPVFFVGSILTVLVSISFSIWLQAVLTIGRVAIYLFLRKHSNWMKCNYYGIWLFVLASLWDFSFAAYDVSFSTY